MIKFWRVYRKRVISDLLLALAAIVPTIAALASDIHGYTAGAFVRSGAVMALFAAFLEFRTHEVQALRERDEFRRLWATVVAITEGLANVDRAAKHCLREMANLIASAGIEPAMGKAEDIKDMVVSERIKSLKRMPIVPESYYKYSYWVSLLGKVLVVSGTVILVFGDFLYSYVPA